MDKQKRRREAKGKDKQKERRKTRTNKERTNRSSDEAPTTAAVVVVSTVPSDVVAFIRHRGLQFSFLLFGANREPST